MKKYNKLVRDNILQHLKKKGIKFKAHIAKSDKEYLDKLKEKLLEEVKEFLESENEEELADIEEVLDAIYEHLGLEKGYVKKVKKQKAKEKGRFWKRFVLEAAE